MTMNRLLTAFAFAGLVLLITGTVMGSAAGADERPRKLGNFHDDYDLPRECPRFLANQKAVHAKVHGSNESNIFFYWRALCAQQDLAASSPKTAAHDYVSTLDFGTLTLDRIPYVSCEIHALSRSRFIWCQKFDRKFPTISQAHYLIFSELFDKPGGFPESTAENIAAARAVPVDHDSCRLEQKDYGHWLYFKRNLVIKDGRAACIKVPARDVYPGFSIAPSRTLFRDVDGDGYMDALLIMRSYGGGGSMATTELIVMTKKQPGPKPLTKVRFQRRWE